MLSLEDFEFSVSSHIKERGWTYFHHGAVKDLQQIGEGHWHAVVFGSRATDIRTNYKKAVRKLIGNQVSNRKEYRDLAKLLLKVKAEIVTSQPAIDELAGKLLERYPRRKAMKEELGVVLRTS